jgi:hypothetical protein
VLKAYPFSEWRPDLAPTNQCTLAQNVYPIANGYGPVKDFQAVTSALDGAFVGGAAFIGSDGNATLLSATATDLNKYSGSWSSVLAIATTSRWRFAQFGNNVLYANGGTLGSYDLIAGTTSTPVDAPTAIDVFRVRDFVMAITDQNEAQWCQFNDSGTWTGGTNQADTQPILGGQAVAGVGGEYGVILRKNGIDRVTYVGEVGTLDVIFQFDEVSAEVGCMAQGSVANHGRLVFFLSERGFEMFDGEAVTPIADEKFNRWFFGTYSRSEIDNIWAAIDPQRTLVLWAMPASPGRIIAYNWTLKRGAVISVDVAALFTGFTSNTSLDALDAIYPGGLDSIPISLDDASLSGGSPLLLIVDSTNTLGTLAGSAMEAMLVQSNIEPVPAKRTRIRSVRPITDATNASLTIDARMRVGDAEAKVSAATMRDNGKMPVRSNGRYNTISLTIPAGEVWTYVQGVECEFEAGDGR